MSVTATATTVVGMAQANVYVTSGTELPVALADLASSDPAIPLTPLERVAREDFIDHFAVLKWDTDLTSKLYGRDEDVKTITDWLLSDPEDAPSAQLAVISGPGGTGKTRLAADVARLMSTEHGWTAAFLPKQNEFRYDVTGDGLLLIVDYPEERPETVNKLFDLLADLHHPTVPVRVVLLSRNGLDHWQDKGALLGWRFRGQELALPGPLSPEDAIALIKDASGRLAEALNRPEPDLSPADAWLAADPLRRRPLFSLALALDAVLHPKEAFDRSHKEVIAALTKRERRRVTEMSKKLGLGAQGLAHYLALAVVADDLSTQDILNLGPMSKADPEEALEALQRTSWWDGTKLTKPAPDLPAALFLAQAFFPPNMTDGPPTLADWLFCVLNGKADGLKDGLSRLLHDVHDVASDARCGEALAKALATMVRNRPEQAEKFRALTYGVPPHWVAPIVIAVCQSLLVNETEQDERAGLFNSLGIGLDALGRKEEALEVTLEAVAIRRALAAERPDAFRPDLASSLNNLGAFYNALGRKEEALEVTLEAVEIRRDLAAARPDAFRPDLASSLNNLGIRYDALGRKKEALEVTLEAVEIRRDLAAARPDAFRPDLASSLNNLGAFYNALGRKEEALEVTLEAVEIRRDLAAARPDAFRPDLASSLNNLGAFYNALGRKEEALEVALEAVELYRALAAARPDAFRPDLASSLNNLGAFYNALGRKEEALEVTLEAVELYRALAAARPDAFRPDLAMSLNNLGAFYNALGRKKEALEVTLEAVELYRALAAARPDAFRPDLARSLNNLGDRLNNTAQPVEALGAYREALEMIGPYFVALPAAYRDQVDYMVEDYRTQCGRNGVEPDQELLAPILAKMAEIGMEVA